jgi:fatty-acyl-CoA synthase
MGNAAKVYRSELNPVSFLRRNAVVFPDTVAMVHGNRRTTYRHMEERTNRFASALRRAGLQKGDRVALLCPNTPAMLEANFGVPKAGGVMVPMNTRLTAHEIAYILQDSGARFLLVDHELYPLIANYDDPTLTLIRSDDTGTSDDPYEMFLTTGDPAPVEDWLTDEEETFAINYTSGTTGNSKGVMSTYRGSYLNALGNVIELGLPLRGCVYLWTLPMFHCSGWCFPWAVTAVAGTHICLRKVDPDLIWSLLESEGVTHGCSAPTVQIMLANAASARRLPHPVIFGVGGAPPSPTLIAQLDALNIRVFHLYGLTEVYGPNTICEWHTEWDALSLDEQAMLRARQGQGYLTAELVRVVDDEMNDVPPDGETQGEVVMRGNTVMKGYFNKPEATDGAFRGGWFHSGDIAVYHPNGYIELKDRQKDIIISGGENISTIEVEQVIVRHPAVLECAVVAIPDDTWGERPKAFVTLKTGASATEADIIAFCRANLAHFKCPAVVEFTDLPKTSTGKVQKYRLREQEWAGREKRIN